MADKEEKKETEQEEVVPAWAKKLQETLEDLPSRLSQALTTEEPEEPEEPEVKEIPLPEIPQPETPPQENPEVVPEEPEEKPKKRKNFRDWLL